MPGWQTETHLAARADSKTALLSHRGMGAHTDHHPGENPSATARAEAIHGDTWNCRISAAVETLSNLKHLWHFKGIYLV